MPGFGRAVVGLADVAVDARHRRRVDDPGVVGLPGLAAVAPVGRRRGGRRRTCPSGGPGSTESHSSSLMLTSMRSRRIPALLTTTSRPPKTCDRLVDERLGAVPGRDVVGVGHRRPAGGGDLVDDLLRRAGVGTAPRPVAAEVVDDHVGAVVGEHQGVLPADAPPGAGNDADPSFAERRPLSDGSVMGPGVGGPPENDGTVGRRCRDRSSRRRGGGRPRPVVRRR